MSNNAELNDNYLLFYFLFSICDNKPVQFDVTECAKLVT